MTYETNRLKEEILGDAKYVYSYDDRGNITAIQEKIKAIVAEEEVIRMEETHSYVYDDKNQLIRENDLSQDKTIVYNYDKGGNLLSRKEYAYTTAETIDETTLENTIEYTYSSQWKDQLAEFNGSEIKYDAIGNPTEYLGKNLTWNGRRLSSYTQNGITTTYTYNADGLRSTKAVGNETTEYYYVGDLLSYEKRGDKELFYTYDFSGNVVRIRYFHDNEDETYYPAVNSRGDVEALYNEDGTVAVRYSYDTWGNILGIKDGNGQEIEEATHIGLVNPIRYRGYYYDAETGFYYVSSRYYDPEIGRFISADDQIAEVGGNVNDYNLYSYCGNNPINRIDPKGHAWEDITKWFSKTWKKVKTTVKNVVKNVKQDIKKYKKNNKSEQRVIEANYVSAYKGTVVIKIPGTSGASFGVMAVGNKVKSTNLVKHEYGHRLQLDDMGVINYTTDIAIPSVTANLLDRMGKLPYDYYGSPWEAGADELGGVCRTYNNTPWPEDACDSYGDLIKLFFE